MDGSFFSFGELAGCGMKWRHSAGPISSIQRLSSCPVAKSCQWISMPAEEPKAIQRRWGTMATVRGGAVLEQMLRYIV